MIGIFDSGSGGLTFLAAMRRRYPEYDYLYFGDYDNCPYGGRSPEEIQDLTINGVKKLFDAGASMVILACNTASAWTLRRLQTEVFPEKNILGVTIPGAEKVIELGLDHVVVFATEQTVKSRTYAERVRILNADITVDEIAISGGLVREIESFLPVQRCHAEVDFEKLFQLYGNDGWQCAGEEWTNAVQKYFGCVCDCSHDQSCTLSTACLSDRNPLFFSTDTTESKKTIQGIVLGCTHYSYLKQGLHKLFPNIPIIDPSEESAEKFQKYVSAHPDLLSRLTKEGRVVFL